MAILGGIFSSGKKEHKKKKDKTNPESPSSPSTLRKRSSSPTTTRTNDHYERDYKIDQDEYVFTTPLGGNSPMGMKSMESFASSSYSRATAPQLPSIHFGRIPSRAEDDGESSSMISPISSRTHSRPFDSVSSLRSATSTLIPPPSRSSLFSGPVYGRDRCCDASCSMSSDQEEQPSSMSTRSLPVDFSSHPAQQQRHPTRQSALSSSTSASPQTSDKKQRRPTSPLATRAKEKEKSSGGGMFGFIRDRKKSQPALEAASSARQRSSLDQQRPPPPPLPQSKNHVVHPASQKGFVPPKRPNNSARVTGSSAELEKSKKKSKATKDEDPVSPSSSFNLVSFRNVTSGSQDPHSPIDLPPPDLTSRSRSRVDSVGSDGSAAITAGAFRQAQARRSTTNLIEAGATTPARRSFSNEPSVAPRRPSMEGSMLLRGRSPSPFGHQPQQMPLPGAPPPPPPSVKLVLTPTSGSAFRAGSEPPPRPPRNRPPGPSRSQPVTPAKSSKSNIFAGVENTETESESEESESESGSGSGSGSGSSEEESEEESDDSDDDAPLGMHRGLQGQKGVVDRKGTITQRKASASASSSTGHSGSRKRSVENPNARPQPAGGLPPRAASMPLDTILLKNPPPRSSSLYAAEMASAPLRPASSGELLMGGNKSGMLQVPSSGAGRKRSVSPNEPGSRSGNSSEHAMTRNGSPAQYSNSTIKPQQSFGNPGAMRSNTGLSMVSRDSDSDATESESETDEEDVPLGIKRSTSAMVLKKGAREPLTSVSKSDLGHGGMMSSARSDASHAGAGRRNAPPNLMTSSSGSPPRIRKSSSKTNQQPLVDLASPSTLNGPSPLRVQTKVSQAGPINTPHRPTQQPLKSAMRPGSTSSNSPTSATGHSGNKWLNAPGSSSNSSYLSTPTTSIFSQPPSRPFAMPTLGYSSSPGGSSNGSYSSSGKIPLTPREGSEVSSAVSSGERRNPPTRPGGHGRKSSVTFEEPHEKNGEEKRRERRRSEAKAAIEMGNAINGPLPDVEVDNESIYSGSSHHHSQNPMNAANMNMGMPGANMPMGVGGWDWAQQQQQQQMMMMLANQAMNNGLGGAQFPGAAMQQQQAGVDPTAFLNAHQQAMLYAKQTFQLAIAQQAMAAAGEEWERSSNVGGSVYGGGGGSVINGMGGGGGGGMTPMMGMGMGLPMGMSPLGMGMMGLPGGMLYPPAPASMYGGSMGGSVYGGGTPSHLGVPGPRRSAGSDMGHGGMTSGKPRQRTRSNAPTPAPPPPPKKTQIAPRQPSPPSSWKKA